MILSLASRHNHNVVACHIFPVGYACSLYLSAGSCELNVVYILLARLKLNVGRDGCLIHLTVVLELDVACCGIVAIDVRQHDSLNIAEARTVCRAHFHLFLGVARHQAKLVGKGAVRHLGVHTLDISLEVGQRRAVLGSGFHIYLCKLMLEVEHSLWRISAHTLCLCTKKVDGSLVVLLLHIKLHHTSCSCCAVRIVSYNVHLAAVVGQVGSLSGRCKVGICRTAFCQSVAVGKVVGGINVGCTSLKGVYTYLVAGVPLVVKGTCLRQGDVGNNLQLGVLGIAAVYFFVAARGKGHSACHCKKHK